MTQYSTLNKLVIFALLPILIGLVYWYFNFANEEAPKALTTLEKTGDECSFIAEKAAMHLPEALPFQKLEKAARKARVLSNCMQDRGYMENAVWVKNAKSIAQKKADSQHVSEDEAYETLRREAMYIFKETPTQSTYWVLANQP